MTQIAEQLSTNAMADRSAYKMFSSAFFRGVSSLLVLTYTEADQSVMKQL